MQTLERSAWLEERNDFREDGGGSWYLGGTDLAKIMGVHPNGSALTVYAEKRGLTELMPETAQMRRGRRMEPFIGETFEHVTGWPIRKADMIRHPEKSFLAVNPDFETEDPEFGLAALETKSHKFWLRDKYYRPGDDEITPWSDFVQPHETIQAIWQCRLGGYATCIVAVMFGLDEDDLFPFRIPYDRELGDLIEDAGTRFVYDHLIPGVPPSLSGAACEEEWLKRRYPSDSGAMVYATPEIDELCSQLGDARRRREVAEEVEDGLAVQIKAFMADASILSSSAGQFTWKQAKDSEVIDWKAIAAELGAPASLIQKYTTLKPGSRRFLTPFRKGK